MSRTPLFMTREDWDDFQEEYEGSFNQPGSTLESSQETRAFLGQYRMEVEKHKKAKGGRPERQRPPSYRRPSEY